MEYSDDIDESVFLFERYGKAICHPPVPFSNARSVCEEMFEERSASARGMFLRATFEHMIRGATIHITAETQRVTALEQVSERVGRKARRRGRNSRLVALHGLLRWRHKIMGEGGDIIGMLKGNRERSK
jgi:hypothetical protein